MINKLSGNKFKLLIIVFFILFYAGMLFRYLERVPQRHYCDFRVYYHAAQVFLSKQDIYFRDLESVTPFKYSPFFAFIMSPIGLLPIKAAAALFFTINFIAAITLFILIKKIILKTNLSAKEGFFLYFSGILLTFRYILLNWDSGQVVIIICALVAGFLYLLSRDKDIPAAALLAASILIKYTSALFIPYLILRKKFKAAAMTFGFLAIWLSLPALYVGIKTNIAYLNSWIPSIINTSLDSGSYYNSKNQSIMSFFLRFASNSDYHVNLIDFGFHHAMLIAYVVSALLYFLILLPKKGKDSSREDYALLFICMPLFNPNGWMLNFVSLIFPYLFLSYYLIKVKLKDFFVLACVILSYIFVSLFSRTLMGTVFEQSTEAFSFVSIGALFLFAAIIKLKFFKTEMVKEKI